VFVCVRGGKERRLLCRLCGDKPAARTATRHQPHPLHQDESSGPKAAGQDALNTGGDTSAKGGRGQERAGGGA